MTMIAFNCYTLKK